MHSDLEKILLEVIDGDEGSWEKLVKRRTELAAENHNCHDLELLMYLDNCDLSKMTIQACIGIGIVLAKRYQDRDYQALILSFGIKYYKIFDSEPRLIKDKIQKQIYAYTIWVQVGKALINRFNRVQEMEANLLERCKELAIKNKDEKGSAYYCLAEMMMNGIGTYHQKKPEGVICYERSAKQGFVPAYRKLASFYDGGENVRRDSVTAKMFYKAAEEGRLDMKGWPDKELKIVVVRPKPERILSEAQISQMGVRFRWGEENLGCRPIPPAALMPISLPSHLAIPKGAPKPGYLIMKMGKRPFPGEETDLPADVVSDGGNSDAETDVTIEAETALSNVATNRI